MAKSLDMYHAEVAGLVVYYMVFLLCYLTCLNLVNKIFLLPQTRLEGITANRTGQFAVVLEVTSPESVTITADCSSEFELFSQMVP